METANQLHAESTHKANAGAALIDAAGGMGRPKQGGFSALNYLLPSADGASRDGFANEFSRLRQGAGAVSQATVLGILLVLVILAAISVAGTGAQLQARYAAIVLLAGIGCWRWGWFVLQNSRAVIYRYLVWPRLARAAREAVAERGAVPELSIVAVTYKEEPWITAVVFGSLYRELASLTGLSRPPRIVLATGCEADDVAMRGIHEEAIGQLTPVEVTAWPPELVLIRGDNGKRNALALAMQNVAENKPHPEGVVILMDGDSLMHRGMLQRVLPVFRLKPDVDAVTTNEDGWARGPAWFAEWISLRFGLRHRSMCSAALSGRLLCLTGRLSAYRASVVNDPGFIEQVHHDRIRHWLWGEFEMLSGDDKSTWYWLAAHGRRMLYVPDAMVTTIEVIKGSATERALANIRRWSGNSLRHSWRAFKLGPKRLGWFCWYSLLDQRLAIFTVLIGPLIFIMALCAGRLDIAAAYLIWLLGTRLLHAAISWYHGGRFSAFYVPLQVLSEWAISVTKIWVLFHPAKQRWQNRGGRSLDSTRGNRLYHWRTALAHYLYALTCAMVILGVGLAGGFLPLVREAGLYLRARERDAVIHHRSASDEESTARRDAREANADTSITASSFWHPAVALNH